MSPPAMGHSAREPFLVTLCKVNCRSPGNNYTHGRNIIQSNTFQHRRAERAGESQDLSSRSSRSLQFVAQWLCQSAASAESSDGRRGARHQRPKGQAFLLGPRPSLPGDLATGLWKLLSSGHAFPLLKMAAFSHTSGHFRVGG